MLPFSGFSSIDRSEGKALLFAAVLSCLFIVVLGVAPPHQRHTRRLTNEVLVPTPAPYRINEPDLSTLDSFAKFRVRPAQFEEVDFTNHSYGPYRLSDGQKINLKLDHGLFELPNSSGWFELKDIYYTDLTGDSREEAIVWLSHETCSPACDGGANLFYVYSERNGKLQPIWQYETGSYADGCGLQSFTAGGTQVVLELFGRCPAERMNRPSPSKFIVKDLTFVVFNFNGRSFEQKSIEYFESSPTDVKNYEPGIRIY